MLFDQKEQKKIQKGKRDPVFNTETMLPISEIRGDTVILKDGGLRAILKVQGVNLDLKNYDEQQLVLEQYKRFLNGLDFPMQILVRNTYLNLSNYLLYMKDNVSKVINPTLHQQGENYVRFLEDIDLKQGLIYVKEFYIVVPYYSTEKDNTNINRPRWIKLLAVLDAKDTSEKIVDRYRSFLKGKKLLDARCSLLTDSLAGMSIKAERIDTEDTINLLFRCYNPTLHTAQAEFSE